MMVLPNTYERQMHWWRAHHEASAVEAQRRQKESLKGLSFKPKLAARPEGHNKQRQVPLSPRGAKQENLHRDRQELGRTIRATDPRSTSPLPHGVTHSRIDLTALRSPATSPRPQGREGYSVTSPAGGERHGSYSNNQLSSSSPPRLSHRSPRPSTTSNAHERGKWRNLRQSATAAGVLSDSGSRTPTGGGGGSRREASHTTRQVRANGEDGRKPNGTFGHRRQKSMARARTAHDLGMTLEDDEEEELKFYEQLQRERREWVKERSQLMTVIELQQRELAKRSSAVQERAAEIARDFSKSVLSYEERLLTVETSLTGEIKDIRQMVHRLIEAATRSDSDHADGTGPTGQQSTPSAPPPPSGPISTGGRRGGHA